MHFKGNFFWLGTIIAIVLSCLTFFIFTYWETLTPISEERVINLQMTTISARDKPWIVKAANDQEKRPTLTDSDIEYARLLHDEFKDFIDIKFQQMVLVERVKNYLKQIYPENWLNMAYAFLEKMFPERVDELYSMFLRSIAYNSWLEENRAELFSKNEEERKKDLWDMRRQIFGDDADEIWKNAILSEKIEDELRIDLLNDQASVSNHAISYIGSITEHYGIEAGDRYIQENQTELVGYLMAQPEVQEKLKDLSLDERRAELDATRREFGMDEAALARWRELDIERDNLRDIGRNYMKEIEKISSTKNNDFTKKKMIKDLRDDLFGEDLSTIIHSEERSGFYRFSHDQKIGLD